MEESKIAKLEQLDKRASFYRGLFASQDFQKFKEEVVDKRIEGYFDVAKTCDLTSEDGKQKAIQSLQRYQDLKFIFDDIFKMYELAGRQAKEELKKLEGA